MVKFFLSFFLLVSLSLADDYIRESDPLHEKIKSFVDSSVYENNAEFINIIFSPKSSFYQKDRVNAVKVVETLKDNGLLKLFFKKPKELNLHFKTAGSPIFFVKLMGDSLRNIGYYRYVTRASNLDNSEFTWSISLVSEYATDPIALQKELKKIACKIVDIERVSSSEWIYTIDMSKAYLNIQPLFKNKKVKLSRSLYAHWLNCSRVKKLRITSSARNNWYPYIAYYDNSLHLLKVIKRDKKHRDATFTIPKNAKYIKISDLYTLKNLKDKLILSPIGSR